MKEDAINQTLRYLEQLRVVLMRDESHFANKRHLISNVVLPNKSLAPLIVNGYPVFQFCYRGTMPIYDNKDRNYESIIRDYYFESTFNLYDFKNNEIEFEESVVIIQHFFSDDKILDIDNRNRKYVIDAIRHTGIISDDNWRVLSIFEEGFKTDAEPYLNVFLLEKENFKDFMEHKDNLSKIENIENNFSEINLEMIENVHDERKKEKDERMKIEEQLF